MYLYFLAYNTLEFNIKFNIIVKWGDKTKPINILEQAANF